MEGLRKGTMNRRSMLKVVTAGLAGPAIPPIPMINRGSFELFAQSTTRYSSRAVDLVRRATVIDMLNPFSLAATLTGPDGKRGNDWLVNPASFKAADRKRFLESGFTVMHAAVGTGGPNAYDSTMRFVGLWNGFIAHNADFLVRVDSPEGL